MRFSKIWYWLVVMAVLILAAGITTLFPQTNDVPVSEETKPLDTVNKVDSGTKVKPQREVPASSSPDLNIDSSDEVKLQQLFNDLRKEYLDTRAESIDWWLEFIAIVLAFFAILIAIAGYIGFREFRRLRDEAERNADEIKERLAEVLESGEALERIRGEVEVSEVRAESDEAMQRTREALSAEVFASNDEEFEKILRDFEQIPNLSFVDKAMVAAYKLQKDDRIEEAVQKWRSIAIIVEEVDKNLAARAWNSVGYLLSKQDDRAEDAILAYDRAVEMKANYADAYCNRGEQKIKLGQYPDAIEDLDKAINLNPDEAKAYMFRGFARLELGKHDALTDFDRIIYMKPDFAVAHVLRGYAKAHLKDFLGAKVDLQNALGLAKQQGEKELMNEIEKDLQELNETE